MNTPPVSHVSAPLTLEERLGLMGTLQELTLEVLELFRPEVPVSDFLQRLAERVGCAAVLCVEATQEGVLSLLGTAGLSRASLAASLPKLARNPEGSGLRWDLLQLPYAELQSQPLLRWSLPCGTPSPGAPVTMLLLYFQRVPTLAGHVAGMLRRLLRVMERAFFHRRLYGHLAEQKTLLQCENEASSEGILVVSTEGKIVSHNHRLMELWPAAELTLGAPEHKLFEAWAAEAEPREKFEEWSSFLRVHPDVTSQAEISLRRGRTFECYSAPIRSAEGASFGRGWYFRDITEHQLAERERNRLLREEQSARGSAEQAVRARDEFLSIAAHELKTPLTPLALRLDALRRWAQAGRPVEISQLDRVHDSMMKLAELVDELLDSARAQNGRLSYRLEPCRFGDVVREVVENFQAVSSHHELRLDAEPEVWVNGDRARLGQVCTNLVDNAIKYSPQGGTVSVALRASGDEALLAVTDSGIGIPKPAQRFLFDRFFRAPNAPLTQFGGMGLGLYITRNIVEHHGGRIWVESEPGRGTTFFVALPALRVGASEGQSSQAPEERPGLAS